MLDDPERPNTIQLSGMNAGPFPMSNGLTRLQARFYGDPQAPAVALAHDGPFDADEALDAGPRDVRARRDRLGRRSAPGDRSARGALARRADRHGSEPALRRARDDGDEDLRPADRLAELDLPAPERRRPEGRADGLRHVGARRVRLRTGPETP